MALIFVGIPFVVRAIQPVLEKLDGSYEEAARVMGAKPFIVFRRVILPELLPAMLSGAGLASDVAWENTEVLFLSQETNLTIQRSRR